LSILIPLAWTRLTRVSARITDSLSMIMDCRLLPLPLLWASFGVAVLGETSSPACETSLLQASGWRANPCSCREGCLSKGGTEALCTQHCEFVAACVAGGKTCEVCGEGAVSKEAEDAGAYIKDCVLKGQNIAKCLDDAYGAATIGNKSDDSSEDPCSCMATCLSKGFTEAKCAKPCKEVNACAAKGVKTCEICEKESMSSNIDKVAASLKACAMSGMQIKQCLAKAGAAFGVGPGDSEPQSTVAPLEASGNKSDDSSEDPCSCMATCLSKGLTEAKCAKLCKEVNVCAAKGVKTCEICGKESASSSIDKVAASLRACAMSAMSDMQTKQCLAKAAAAFGVGPGDSEPQTTVAPLEASID